jgi:hypothetical protein
MLSSGSGQELQVMHTIAAKALIIILAAAAVGGGVVLFTIAKQDGSKAGQFLGIAIPVVAIFTAIYFTI